MMLIFTLGMCTNANTVLAESSQDGLLSAEIQTESTADNAADVTVIIRNIGSEPVHNVLVTGNIPDGMELLQGNSIQKEIGTLVPGSESALQYSVYVKSGDTQPEENQNSQTTQNGSQDSQHNKNASTLKTGDNANIAPYILVGAAAVLLIIIVCIKKKKIKGMLSLMLCISMIIPLLMNVGTVKAADAEKSSFSVTGQIVLGEKEYVAGADISYEKSKAVEPAGEILTKAQWIDELLDILGYDGQEVSYDDELLPFTDISEHTLKNEILLAYGNSILPDQGAEFSPNAPATREFAAVTAVKALAFKPIRDIVCTDASEITYKQEVETAVAMDIFQLDNGSFYPARELTRAEADSALEGISAIINSGETEDSGGSISYDSKVMIISDDVDYEINGTIITFTPASSVKELKENMIFVLPDQTPYKAVTVNIEKDVCIVDTAEPSIEETLTGLEVQGTGTVDTSQFIPAEGVTITENPASRISTRANIVDAEGTLGGPGKIDFTIHKQLGPGELSGKLSISVPKIKYKADVDLGWGGFNIKNVYIKVPTEVEIEGSYKIESGEGDDGYIGRPIEPYGGIIELGKLPVAGIPGVTVFVQVGVQYDIEGQLHATYKVEGTAGLQVLNNRLRMVKELESKFEIPTLEATVKIGPGVSGLLEVCNRWDLIDFGLSVGAAASGELTVRDPSLSCVDADLYLYGELSALDEGVIGDWLDIGYTLDFWNKDNSPLKHNWHFENLVHVDECTYEAAHNGTVKGMVAKASDRSTPIENAKIEVYDKGDLERVRNVTTDQNGNYEIKVPAGDYVIIISANGYITFEYDVTVGEGEEKYIETFLMVDEGQPGQKGVADGIITNAVTGNTVEGASVSFREGWNKTRGEVEATVLTDASGRYQVELPIGNYTASISKQGYVSNTKNIVVLPVSLMPQNATLVPTGEEVPEGDLRVVLTWGESPSDLDSHLVGPTADGESYFHIYYRNKNYTADSVKYADLDVDDTSSYGPETTTVYQKNSSGIYSFYVHDYSNRSFSSSTAMSESGAIVEVYVGGQFYQAYPVPTGKEGVYWHVFDYDANTNMIIPVNEFTSSIEYRSQQNTRMAAQIISAEEKK